MTRKKKKVMTINDLAIMTAKGFSDVHKELTAVRSDVKEVKDATERIEFRMSAQERRIEILEDKMRIVSTKLGLRR